MNIAVVRRSDLYDAKTILDFQDEKLLSAASRLRLFLLIKAGGFLTVSFSGWDDERAALLKSLLVFH